jgi:hypothetical protein
MLSQYLVTTGAQFIFIPTINMFKYITNFTCLNFKLSNKIKITGRTFTCRMSSDCYLIHAVSCLAYSSTSDMEAINSSETSVDF